MTTMTATRPELGSDRRAHARLKMERPCKVFDPRSRKYIAGTTCDVSTHGILLSIPRPVALRPDDTVLVGVAVDDRREELLHAKDLVEMVVVRTLRTWEGGTMMAARVVNEDESDVTLSVAA